MKKTIALLLCLVFVSGCVGNDIKGNVSIENDSIVFTPEPITVKIQDVIDVGINYVKDLFDFSKEETINESVSEEISN